MLDLRTAKRIAHICPFIPTSTSFPETEEIQVECGKELVKAAITVLHGHLASKPELIDLVNNLSMWLQANQEG